jgi:enterochelin esterase family protein
MNSRVRTSLSIAAGLLVLFAALFSRVAAPAAIAQEPARAPQPAAPGGRGPQAPQVVSPEVSTDRKVTFRVYAANAQAIRLAASDIPGVGQTTQLTKADSGVWEVTVGPLEPGAYRYNFNVDGVSTIDPRNPDTSGSNNNVWSLVYVPGSEVFDTREVPRGAVAEVTYRSSALGRFRRMHVYTPPGYATAQDRLPVFYLLHGAGDNDDAWSSVGRAGFILDNLIAAKKARPMIVVMPAGHTSRTNTGATSRSAMDEFVRDFVTDVMPYVEKNYRVLTDRANTAIAGLSMGGGQTLQVAIPRLERFGYIGVYSSGLLGAFPQLATTGGRGGAAPPGTEPPPTAADWEKANAATLDNAALKKGLRLFWFATGKDDFLLTTTQATVDLFKKHGFAVTYKESAGGHTWINWRNYLAEFAPQLFQPAARSTSQ